MTSLGKEKNARVPLFDQEDEHYPLTREGRLALGLEDDDALEDWAQARAKRQGRQLGPAKDQGKEGKEGKRAAAPASPPQQLFVPPPPPPSEWVFPLEGDRIDVEAEVGAVAAWATA